MADEFKIVASLNIPESASRINKDIPKLEGQAKHLKIVADLNPTLSIKNIQATLNKMNNNANIKIGIDTSGLNSVQGATQNITNGLKSVQTQAQQTAKSINDIVTTLSSNQISDSSVQSFQKQLGIIGVQAEQTSALFKNLMSQLHNAWYAGDVQAYNTALDDVHTKIVENYESTKEYKKQVQELSNIYRSTLTDGSKVFIDSNLRKELEYNIQNAKQLKSILDTVYGVGKWSYKSGIGADTLFKNNKEYMSAQAILDVYNQINSAKSQISLNSRPEDYDAQIKKLLDLKTAYTDINGVYREYIDGLGWFESVNDNVVKNINEETTAIQKNTQAYEKLKAIKDTTEYDAFGQITGRTSVYGDTGFKKTSKYNENDELTSYTITENYEALAKSIDKAEAKATKLEQRLMSLYESAERGSKPIKDISHWTKLAEQAGIASNAIEKIRQADSRNASSIEATANAEISKLQDLIRQYQNAEYAAESLRTKDVNTVKNIQTQELDKSINKINGSKVSLDTMATDVNELRTALANVGDKDSLTKFLNQFDIAKAKFESLKTLYQSIGGYDKQLDKLAQDWQKQGIYVGNVKTTIESLKASLANVNTSDGLTTWISDFNSQISNISKLPIEIAKYKQEITATRDEWKSQGIYVGEIQSKVTSLARSLPNIKKPEKFNEWVQEWNDINQKANQLKVNLDSQVATHNKIYEIQSQIAKLNPTKDTAEIARLNEKLSAEQKTLSNLQMQSNVYSNLVSLEQQEQYITEQTVKSRDKLLSATNSGVKQYQTTITNAITELQGIANSAVFTKNASNSQVTRTKQEINSLITAYQNLATKLQGNITPAGLETVRTELTQLNARFNNATTSAKRFETELINDNGAEQLAQKVKLLNERIKAYRQANSKSEKMFGSQYDSMLSQLANPNIDLNTYNALNKQFQTMRQEINAANVAGKNLWQTLKEKAGKFVGWMSLTGIISSIWREMRQMVTNVVEIDKAMTNLKKVTDETDTTYARFLKNANQQAKELHSTVTDLVEQVATWSKLGYSLSESQNLAKTSMIYSNVGEVDNTTAVSDLVTVMKAFNIESEKSIRIVDSLNELGNNFATDAASLGEGLTKSASALNAANNSFEQSIALLTGGTEITQNANEMGSALKIISMRIRGMKGELEDLGEEYDNIESVSKIQTQILNLTSGKVNIFDDNGNFRSTYDILKDISEIYDKLSDPDKADLTEILFGKMRGNQGIAIIQAFQSGQIEKAYEAAKNSAGSAQEEFDRWSQSIEAHINTFKASFESLSQTILDSNLIKFVVDFGTTTLNTLDNIISKFGTLPTLLGSIATVGVFKNVGGLINTPPYAPLQLCA